MIAIVSFAHFKVCLFLDAGTVDPACVLEQIERQVAHVKEEALSRKEILEKVEKWLAACDEESWLEEYNRVSCLYSPFGIWASIFSIILVKSAPSSFYSFSRMKIDTMLGEALILHSSALRKLVAWLTKFQVFIDLNCYACICHGPIYIHQT